ncbi:glycosyltransferase family 4 protein [Stygiolobus caldivivus]|uniref:Glycosyltransferase subfamily 4-like N-terminal domain-containing protein n=1 Tax=Stygiolobus caldivivus TaxID=2824673 RepID=A0A8D5U4E1_9CREN|nr:glycosyltransferase family 4 protein [Stygiolobus caldivivus]BCU69064.1 hypothetical protein KN1_03610 [Stygiolobus caldivivus]
MMDSIYPQRGGIHEQVYLNLRELQRRNIDAKIISYSERRAEEPGKKLLWLRQLSPFFLKKIIKEDPNIIISETAWPILPSLISSKLSGAKCILHLHSLESIQDVGLTKIGKRIIRIFEGLSKKCDAILVPSKVELNLLRGQGIDKEKIFVYPNVIDVEAFNSYKPAQLNHPAVVFVGGMGYPPNREAAQMITKIAEIVNRKLNGKNKVNFYLVGPSPPPVSPPVYATGYVESTVPYILGADICVAPIKRGGGVKLKVLEYMASGKPIIATKKAIEGIDDICYVNAETEEEFAEKIISIINDDNEIERFKANKEIVAKNHSPKTAIDLLLKIIDDLNRGKLR